MSEKTQQITDTELEQKQGQNGKSSDYSADSITVLEGLEAVRLRPAIRGIRIS